MEKAEGQFREKIKNSVKVMQRRSPLVKKAVAFVKKRKKLMLCAVALAAVLLLALIFLLLAFAGGMRVLIAATLFAGILAAAVLATNSLCKYWINWEKPTSYFTDLRHRNTAGIVLGGTKAWKYVRSELFFDTENELYNCTAYRRSLKMDFATLKTYYSHVRRGGKVFILFDYTEAEKMGEKILPCDFKYVHPHYFLYTEEKENRRKSTWPIFFYPGFTIGFVWCKLLKYAGFYRNATWNVTDNKNMDIDTEQIYRMAAILNQMFGFCRERELEPVLILLSGNENDNIANDILRAYFTPKYYFQDIIIADSSEKMNRTIKGALDMERQENG